MASDMEKESITFSMATFTKDLGPTIKNKATVNLKCKQAICIKEVGEMEKNMDLASTLLQTEITMKEIF